MTGGGEVQGPVGVDDEDDGEDGLDGGCSGPPGAPVPRCLTEVEKLTGTGLQLAATNIVLQKQLLLARSQDLQRENQALDAKLRTKQEEIKLFKDSLTAKYNIDFTKEQIDVETGRIIPAP